MTLTGAHTHPDLDDSLASLRADLVAAAGRLLAVEARQDLDDAATRALLARVAKLEAVDPTPPPPPVNPTPPPVEPPPAPPVTGWAANGIPPVGKTLAGASVANGTEATVAAFEAKVGRLGIRRSYWQSSGVASAMSTARADLAAGRIPWLSFKLPQSWTDMAAGKGDAWVTDLGTKLAALPGPVWVALHHEPEGDGVAADYRAMQARCLPMLGKHANVATTLILTGWGEVLGSQKIADYWPGDGVDILGMDPYNWWGTSASEGSKVRTTWDELRVYYDAMSAWSATHGCRWAVAECGYSDTAAARDAAWLTRAYDDMRAMGGVALAYFNVSAATNGEPSNWTWPITSEPKVGTMRAVLAKADRLP